MNSSEKKMTYLSALTYVLESCEMPDEVREKMEALRASHERKATADKKPTKNQVVNVALADVVLNTLREMGTPSTATDIFKMVENENIQSVQKVTALLRALLLEGKVVKTQGEKRTTLFSAV